MGFTRTYVVERVIINEVIQTPRALQVFTEIKSFQNGRTKQCNPSDETIAKRLRLSTRQVVRVRQELQCVGVLSWERGQYSNNYSFPARDGAGDMSYDIAMSQLNLAEMRQELAQMRQKKGSDVTKTTVRCDKAMSNKLDELDELDELGNTNIEKQNRAIVYDCTCEDDSTPFPCPVHAEAIAEMVKCTCYELGGEECPSHGYD